MDILEMAEPDGRDSGGQRVPISPVGSESIDLPKVAKWGPSEKVKILKFFGES